MTKIYFIEKDGNKKEIDAPNGISILDVARKFDIDIEGACEGSLACSTCHVIVDEESFKKLPLAEEDEEDMLDLAFGLTKTSRLGCQIMISDELADMVLTLPTANRNIMIEK